MTARGRAAIVRRLLPATPDVVYDEWLDPAALADWMCPRPARCRNVESEPRPAGGCGSTSRTAARSSTSAASTWCSTGQPG
jgi:uncharacterized protein YndB with AHSA1/START domain